MLTTPIWSAVFVIAILAILAFIVAIRLFGKNLLQRAEENKNYYVLTDVVAVDNDGFQKELDQVQNRYKVLTRCLMILIVVLLILMAILSGRPGKAISHNDDISNRDIMLCLDVSGSTLLFDRKVLEAYKNVVANFSGERIGFQIFDSTSRTVFPLTSDYNIVNRILDDSIEVLTPIQPNITVEMLSTENRISLLSFLAGTSSKTDSASLIGDGLAGCALSFDNNQTDRPRSIIFATDNMLSGSPVYTLDEAASYLENQNISLYSIFSGTTSEEGQAAEVQLKEVTQKHGGNYLVLKSDSTVYSIVSKIQDQDQSNLNPDGLRTVDDDPTVVIGLIAFFFALYVLVAWRLRQ
jgi:hypothetical protein